VTARVFQFPQYAAERHAGLTRAQSLYVRPTQRSGGRPWGWLFLITVLGGSGSVVSGFVYWTTTPQRDTGAWLMLGGVALLAISAICFCRWVWRLLHAEPPWGRLMLLGLVLNYFVGRPLAATYPWSVPALSVLGWGVLIGLVLRWRQIRRRRSARDQVVHHGTSASIASTVADKDEAARWAAGTFGEEIVASALARLGNDHVIIHNLPIERRGDADHVVVGPADAVVVETKYLAGRIVC
jgi:hypothetical protein